MTMSDRYLYFLFFLCDARSPPYWMRLTTTMRMMIVANMNVGTEALVAVADGDIPEAAAADGTGHGRCPDEVDDEDCDVVDDRRQASGRRTLRMIWKGVAPMDSAASTRP